MKSDTTMHSHNAADTSKNAPAEKIRVLLLLPSLHGGGAERMAALILKHHDPSRFEVRMGLLREAGPYLNELNRTQIDVSPIGASLLNYDGPNAESYRLSRVVPSVALAPLNTWAMMRRFQPHVVMSFLKGMSLCTMAASTLYGRNRVGWIAREGNNTLAVLRDELTQPFVLKTMTRIVSRCYRSADVLLTISQDMASDLIADLKLDKWRVQTIYNAVDISRVRRQAVQPLPLALSRPFLLTVGRMERQKGHDVLLRAYAQSSVCSKFDLVIVGKGSEQANLERLVQELGIKDRVHFVSFTENPWTYMAHATAFVLPSRWEGFGNVIIEAMACRAAVIVTDCNYGPREIVTHGRNGLIVPVDNVDALRGALDTLLTDAALRQKFADAGYAHAANFDVSTIIRRYEALFEEVYRSMFITKV